ncbi:MAG: 16S rRNA (guanine(966)-N(2))-methyltransferase RsmD [Lactobacillales bacterium]|jgi:16S rRNA (guanine966-N2)-methyltransferase|nr:16S rRNA (guanine(966)-N(2))-methyltransferase RsmD [Lactobacillales bacterium]
MRIISGTFRGKKLLSPDREGTRPTSDRSKEALFSILGSYLKSIGKSWADITFADVFSGAGAIGLEAYSRGAKEVFFFENHPGAMEIINKNRAALKLPPIGIQDALIPPKKEQPVDIIFFDAPYGKGLWQQSLEAFFQKGWMSEKTLIVIENDSKHEEIVPSGFILKEKRNYGRNQFSLLILQET